MNKFSINLKLPFAIQSEAVINPQNGYKYTKRITQEFKDLQQFARENSIYMNAKDDEIVTEINGKPLYKNIWINLNTEFIKEDILNKLTGMIYKAFNSQTPTKFNFE